MPALRTNIVANYIGQFWMVLMGVAFVPLYIRLLGIESFGLIGFMLGLQSVSQLFDFGLGGLVNRELARRGHDASARLSAPDLVRTLEIVIWPTSLLIGVAIFLCSSFIAGAWLHPQHLSPEEMARSISVMGVAIALQWPSGFYANALSGLEQQSKLNLINAVFATLRGVGVLPVLYWISTTVEAFFWWHAAVGFCQSVVCASVLWRHLPKCGRAPKFDADELHSARAFAGGLLAINILALGLTQIDRFTLSALRPLQELGYYTLALSIASGLGRMVQPMFNALYPRFSRLVAIRDSAELSHLYHLSSQCLAVVVAAVSLVLIVFARDIIYLWTGNYDLATKVELPLSILIAGTGLNGLMNLPYAMQLANGWTQLARNMNVVSLLLGIPFCIWSVSRYGMVGAACLWLFVNFGYFSIGIPLMHQRLLRGEARRWYSTDVLPPLLAATIVATFCGRALHPTIGRSVAGILTLAAISFATLTAAALASPGPRRLLVAHLRGWRP